MPSFYHLHFSFAYFNFPDYSSTPTCAVPVGGKRILFRINNTFWYYLVFFRPAKEQGTLAANPQTAFHFSPCRVSDAGQVRVLGNRLILPPWGMDSHEARAPGG